MINFTIGCDPDSEAHGVAIYKNGALSELHNLNLLDFMDKLIELKPLGDIHVHIENLNGNKAVWHGKDQNKKAYGMTSQNVAKCKQAQIEVERMLTKLGIPFTQHPVSSAWKSQEAKKQFELATGWKGNSNEDKRSAAYFGFIGCGNQKALSLSLCQPYVPTPTKFKQVKAKAMEKAALAASREPELKKANAARRVINQTFLSALKEAGIENWRELVKQKKSVIENEEDIHRRTNDRFTRIQQASIFQ